MDTDAQRCLSLVHMMVIGITGLLLYGSVASLQFDTSPQFFQFYENKSTPIGTVLFVLRASDSGNPLNEMIISTSDADTSFYVNILQLSKTSPALANITLKNELDRESINRSIVLYILDVCDEAPVFDRPYYTLEIDEINIYSARVVFSQIHATDSDSAMHAIVTYRMEVRFQPKTESSYLAELYNETFRINPMNGSIYLLRSLDYENNSLYRFNIYSHVRDWFCQEHFVLNSTTGEIVINGRLDWGTDEMKRIHGVCNFIVQAKEIDNHPDNQRGQTVANASVTVIILQSNIQTPPIPINWTTTNNVHTGEYINFSSRRYIQSHITIFI
ncbi:hypothetical protein ACJMK2_034840 [Sinanodonta woodiana]|uniref:Cadherin domain-containing protein n=1 Tax=Sinanodonta woodiana TaxID=1069815 RepID=A0ABD3WSX5_SINWO